MSTSEAAALDAAAAALCDRKVAVLGEAEHGDARTETFKIALIERLVAQCGYSAVLFEASFYEFVQLDRIRRGGRQVTPDQIATAVGGLWKFDREFQPLLPYLASRINTGTVRLGGFDFQLGGVGQDFTNFGVTAELAGELAPEDGQRCRAVFRDMLFTGNNPERRRVAATCLALIGGLPRSVDPNVRRERQEMLANLSAFAAADPVETNNYFASRDREMFANFKRWMARWPSETKAIIWTANSHAARAPHGHAGFEGIKPFGAYLAGHYGGEVFALGFAAQAGTMRGHPAPHLIETVEPDSLEAVVGPITRDGAVFFDKTALANAGARPSGMFSYSPIVADWAQLFDGVVVFDHQDAAGDIRTDEVPK
ncbi:erythromycin esterase family protein [Altererythrobacter sp. Z27]|uniref:erythromycin esterase family protein n=1 Tax=Altererythrobacter sp. Z27 TaxID=3461147 RepID=UPI004043C1C3